MAKSSRMLSCRKKQVSPCSFHSRRRLLRQRIPIQLLKETRKNTGPQLSGSGVPCRGCLVETRVTITLTEIGIRGKTGLRRVLMWKKTQWSLRSGKWFGWEKLPSVSSLTSQLHPALTLLVFFRQRSVESGITCIRNGHGERIARTHLSTLK